MYLQIFYAYFKCYILNIQIIIKRTLKKDSAVLSLHYANKKYIDLIFFQIYEKIFSTNAFIYTYFMAILNVIF